MRFLLDGFRMATGMKEGKVVCESVKLADFELLYCPRFVLEHVHRQLHDIVDSLCLLLSIFLPVLCKRNFARFSLSLFISVYIWSHGTNDI